MALAWRRRRRRRSGRSANERIESGAHTSFLDKMAQIFNEVMDSLILPGKFTEGRLSL